MTKVASGTHIDHQEASQYVKTEIDRVVDKSQLACKTASKTVIVGIIPSVASSVANGLRFFKCPEGFCRVIENFGGSNFNGSAETAAGHCTKATSSCAKATLHGCVDSSSKSKEIFFSWFVSWFTK